MAEKAKADDVYIGKAVLEHYFDVYGTYLRPLREMPIKFLELGVAEGESLAHWEQWLPHAEITGLDVKPCPRSFDSGRVVTFVGEQQDKALLDRVAAARAPEGFDVIIDDASHVGQLTRISFWHLFEHHLKPGGYYFIEDWGSGYWPSYPDGRRLREAPVDFAWHERSLNSLAANPVVQKIMPLRKVVSKLRWELVTKRIRSHDYGMVGFVKSLVDEMGMDDVAHHVLGDGSGRTSRFALLRFAKGQVIIQKAR